MDDLLCYHGSKAWFWKHGVKHIFIQLYPSYAYPQLDSDEWIEVVW